MRGLATKNKSSILRGIGCLLTVLACMTCRATGSLDEVLSCLETNGVLVDRSQAVRSGLEGILKSIDSGAFLGEGAGLGGEINGITGSTQTVQAVELWPEDIAYLKIQGLRKGGGAEILSRLQALNNKAGIILDLRGASGDDLNTVSLLAGLVYRKQEPLYILTDNRGHPLSTNVAETVTSIRAPLMVLVDGRTRGAAEALAALWRGRPGIMLIGSMTHGEARFRDVMTLPDGLTITLATRKLVPLHGQSYDGCGIKPDVNVERLASNTGNEILFNTNRPNRVLSAKSERDRDLMRRVDGDTVLQRATDILLGLRTLGGYGQQ